MRKVDFGKESEFIYNNFLKILAIRELNPDFSGKIVQGHGMGPFQLD